jgi:hypothetical protein
MSYPTTRQVESGYVARIINIILVGFERLSDYRYVHMSCELALEEYMKQRRNISSSRSAHPWHYPGDSRTGRKR